MVFTGTRPFTRMSSFSAPIQSAALMVIFTWALPSLALTVSPSRPAALPFFSASMSMNWPQLTTALPLRSAVVKSFTVTCGSLFLPVST